MRAASTEAMSSEFSAEVRGDLLIVTEPVSEFHAIYVKRPGRRQLAVSSRKLRSSKRRSFRSSAMTALHAQERRRAKSHPPTGLEGWSGGTLVRNQRNSDM